MRSTEGISFQQNELASRTVFPSGHGDNNAVIGREIRSYDAN